MFLQSSISSAKIETKKMGKCGVLDSPFDSSQPLTLRSCW